MNIKIKQVGITEMKERTWGRVFVDYEQDGENKFIFRNYIRFEKKNFSGDDSFEDEAAFTWFDKNHVTEDYMAVLEGEYDNLFLAGANHKQQYGTPSTLLESLISDIDSGLMEDVNNRRGWYK